MPVATIHADAAHVYIHVYSAGTYQQPSIHECDVAYPPSLGHTIGSIQPALVSPIRLALPMMYIGNVRERRHASKELPVADLWRCIRGKAAADVLHNFKHVNCAVPDKSCTSSASSVTLRPN